MMSTIETPAKPIHYVQLDSLRGLGALTVVLAHFQFLWATDAQPISTILNFFSDLLESFGYAALMMFFVLSGFVLSLPAVDGRPQPYLTFVTRRIFRIYFPYLAVLAASIAGALWLHGIVTRSEWFNASWSEPVSRTLVLQHLLFLGVYDALQFDSPIWTLVHEMRISLIFPLLCGFVLRLKRRWSFAIAGGLTLFAVVAIKRPLYPNLSLADSFQYAGLFVLGIFLAREKSRLGAWFRCRRRIERVVIGAASLWLFLFSIQLFTGVAVHALAFQRSLLHVSQWLAAFGAGGLMIVSLNSESCTRVLSWRPIHFLGQISYSLYLWHLVVLLYCVHLFYGKAPLWAILCLAFILSIFVSWYFYRWVVVPSIQLGRRLSNAFQRPSAA